MGRFFNFKHIWQKFAFFIILIVVATLLIASYIQSKSNNALSLDDSNKKLNVMLNLASIALSDPMWNLNKKGISLIGDSFFEDSEVSRVTVTDEILGEVYKKNNERAAHSSEYLLTQERNILRNDKVMGTVQISITRYYQLEKTRNSFNARLIETLMLSIILTVSITIISAIVMRPLRALDMGIEEIAAGKYEKQLPIMSADEIGRLTQKFNSMSKSIFEAKATLKAMNKILERKVEERTAQLYIKNQELEETVTIVEETQSELIDTNHELGAVLENLKETQEQLIQSGKMALLGNLVAGVAHEINTPIGVSLTLGSYINREIITFVKTMNEGTLTKKTLVEHLDLTRESSESLVRNLERAAELINNFKQVAVDQTSELIRSFKLKKYLHEIRTSLYSKFKNTNYKINIECPENLELTSYPGIYYRIITNLLLNSLTHGFENRDDGNINICVEVDGERLILRYSDDGVGVSADILPKIFDPFFTTARGKGGSGLGLNIVYNSVLEGLNGTIRCESEVGMSTLFTINVPLNIEMKEQS